MTRQAATAAAGSPEPDLWRALASPWRRRLLDLLRDGPATTGALAGQIPQLSRFAVMQHLGVLADAGVVLVERRGRDRFNYLNPVPLREWYERWVQPLADADAAALLRLKRTVETGGDAMPTITESVRTVRLAYELRVGASARRIFEVMTGRSLEWFPHTYGGDRVRAVVLEPRVGGRHYEDWGGDEGHLYGQVTLFDPPRAWATRGRLSPGVVLDTEYELAEEPGPITVVRIIKVAVGPISDAEAEGISTFGDLRNYAPAIEALAAS
ncbi:MAG TPA: helix-turn-helix domain-containing protein [Streptosporangiaceae bacterium]|nr:helix-turn-helix domain-containing protein [Streptosporangiaceae bacterium]